MHQLRMLPNHVLIICSYSIIILHLLFIDSWAHWHRSFKNDGGLFQPLPAIVTKHWFRLIRIMILMNVKILTRENA